MIRFQLLSTEDDAIQFSGGKSDEAKGAYPFVATVTYVGRLSTHMVGGTDVIDGGPYRVFISSELGRKKLKDLVGKSVFITDSLDTHENGIQAGKFEQVWAEETGEIGETGDEVLAIKASGIIYRNTKPSLVDKVIGEARKKKLGFSYDLKAGLYKIRSLKSDDAEQPSEQYVELTDFTWRGATILYRDAAAYSETKLAASKIQTKESDMDTKQAEEILAGMKALTESVGEIAKAQGKQSARLEAIEKGGVKSQAKASGGAVPIEGFAKTIAETVTASITGSLKPMADAMEKLATALVASGEKKTEGERKSLTVADLQLKGTGLKDDEPVTDDALLAAQQVIGASTSMSREEKAMQLARIGQVRTALSIGHPGYTN